MRNIWQNLTPPASQAKSPQPVVTIGPDIERAKEMAIAHRRNIEKALPTGYDKLSGPGYVVQNLAEVITKNHERNQAAAERSGVRDLYKKQGFSDADAKLASMSKVHQQFILQNKMAEKKSKLAHQRALELETHKATLEAQTKKGDLGDAFSTPSVVELTLPDGSKKYANGIRYKSGQGRLIDTGQGPLPEGTRQRWLTKPEEKIWEEKETQRIKAHAKNMEAYQHAKDISDSTQAAVNNLYEFINRNPNWQNLVGWRGKLQDMSPEAHEFATALAAVKASGFMSVYNKLKGAGAITENETKQAQPMIDIINNSTDPAAVIRAVGYLKASVELGELRAAARVGDKNAQAKLEQIRTRRRERYQELLTGSAKEVSYQDGGRATEDGLADVMRPEDEVGSDGLSADPRDVARRQQQSANEKGAQEKAQAPKYENIDGERNALVKALEAKKRANVASSRKKAVQRRRNRSDRTF